MDFSARLVEEPKWAYRIISMILFAHQNYRGLEHGALWLWPPARPIYSPNGAIHLQNGLLRLIFAALFPFIIRLFCHSLFKVQIKWLFLLWRILVFFAAGVYRCRDRALRDERFQRFIFHIAKLLAVTRLVKRFKALRLSRPHVRIDLVH